MITSTTFLSIIKALVFPPGGFITALIIAFIVSRWLPKTGLWLAVIASVVFVAICMPRVSLWLSDPNEHFAKTTSAQWQKAQAIVVLGGGRSAAIPGYTPERVNLDTFGRVTVAARLAKKTGLPILLTGGKPGGEKVSEAELMETALSEDFGIKARWIESESRNTRENAEFSAPLLKRDHIHTIILVTTAFHVARGERNFRRMGLDVLPAASGFSTAPPGIMGWMPSTLGLAQSQRALQEYVGWWFGR